MTFTLHELDDVAKKLLATAGDRRVWLFHGEMGAGKTTLIKSLCSELGVTSSMTSPTFSIVNEYDGNKGTIYHFDFYRLKNENEAYDIGVDEYLESGNFCFIEWPERIPSLLPLKYFELDIILVDASTRSIEYKIV